MEGVSCAQGLVQGKLDQKSRRFVVKYAVGRDTHHEDIDSMIQKLTNWLGRCGAYRPCSRRKAHLDGGGVRRKLESAVICGTVDQILEYVSAFGVGSAMSHLTMKWTCSGKRTSSQTARRCTRTRFAPRWRLAPTNATRLAVRERVARQRTSACSQTSQLEEGTPHALDAVSVVCN